MVPILSIIFMLISTLISIGLPVALIIWVMKKSFSLFELSEIEVAK